jgi:hypothetical protein
MPDRELIAVTSDGIRCEKGLFFRGIEKKIAQAQLLSQKRPLKVFRTACAQQHILDAEERALLADMSPKAMSTSGVCVPW